MLKTQEDLLHLYNAIKSYIISLDPTSSTDNIILGYMKNIYNHINMTLYLFGNHNSQYNLGHIIRLCKQNIQDCKKNLPDTMVKNEILLHLSEMLTDLNGLQDMLANNKKKEA